MNGPGLDCLIPARRRRMRERQAQGRRLTGLDYIEVGEDQRTLTVVFIGPAPEELAEKNFLIEGGRRVRGVRVTRIEWQENSEDDTAVLTVDRPGDFSIYTLRLVEDRDGNPTRLANIDPRYDALEFSFKVDCPSELDCATSEPCPPVEHPAPSLDYLAKDAASFRQLIFDRLSLIMPAWQERHAADIGVTLVELLAYVGDHLSYHQDAVATEAYLGTARQRVSIRRHARLIDYVMHEGCNARAWITIETSQDLTKDSDAPLRAGDISFITRLPEIAAQGKVLTWESDELQRRPASAYEVFQPVTSSPDEVIELYVAHNTIRFYTWGDEQCCLPRESTRATLMDRWVCIPKALPGEAPVQSVPERKGSPVQHSSGGYCPPEPPEPSCELRRELHIQVGDILIFEEVLGPRTGLVQDADPGHRQAVRVIRVAEAEDPLELVDVAGWPDKLPRPLLEIEWAPEDALAFPLCISTLGPAPQCELLEPVSVVRGNVVLVDHGRTVRDEDLGVVLEKETRAACEGPGQPSEIERTPWRFRPVLKEQALTFRAPLPTPGVCDHLQGQPRLFPPASVMLDQDPRLALPQVTLTSEQPGLLPRDWKAHSDLLGSGPNDREFVVEVDNRGRAHIRFGDGDLGRSPEPGMRFRAEYRVGNGPAGNVGAEAIGIAVTRSLVSGLELLPRNPLPAQGGLAPESIEDVRLLAPGVIRTRMQRAIVAEDYARIAETYPARPGDARRPRVQRAAASLMWNGSWYEVLVALDPLGRAEADELLLCDVEQLLHRYRKIGHDLRVTGARYVPLHVAMDVCVKPGQLRGHVRAALLDTLGNRLLADGRRGFFHPDNLTFGQGVYLSRLVSAAQAVEGVESVQVMKLERIFEGTNGELELGVLQLGPLEVARLDNNPANPENGLLELTLRGGR